MNNREKTAKVIRAWQNRHRDELDNNTLASSHNLAESLADAGLIAPDPPTMADVEWRDTRHYLAGAEDYEGNEVVMLEKVNDNIRVCDVDKLSVAFVTSLEPPQNLTPNGKRYRLTSLKELDDQEKRARPERRVELLFRASDYENAPIGTIVALTEQPPYVKLGANKWTDSFGDVYSDEGMSGTCRSVLRSGW